MSRATREREAFLIGMPWTLDTTRYYERMSVLEIHAHRDKTVGRWQAYMRHIVGHLSLIEASGDAAMMSDALDRLDMAAAHVRAITGNEAE